MVKIIIKLIRTEDIRKKAYNGIYLLKVNKTQYNTIKVFYIPLFPRQKSETIIS